MENLSRCELGAIRCAERTALITGAVEAKARCVAVMSGQQAAAELRRPNGIEQFDQEALGEIANPDYAQIAMLIGGLLARDKDTRRRAMELAESLIQPIVMRHANLEAEHARSMATHEFRPVYAEASA